MSRLSHVLGVVFVVSVSTAGSRAFAQAAPATPVAPATPAAPPTAAAPATPAAPPTAAAPATPPVAPPPAAEPMGMGEQPGGAVYGAEPAPGQAQPYEYNATLPEWADSQCPLGRCGPDCHERCRRHEYCSEYGTCEEIPEVAGQEHRGLMVRATTGYGFGTLAASGAGVREGSLMIGLAVDAGGTVAENLIVRGRLRGGVSYYRDNDFGHEVLFSFGTLGAGVDYYFMPINIYVGGTVSVAGITRGDEDHVNRSKAGLGLDLDVGKEWWVSRRWGIGIALRATYIDVAPANILTASRISAPGDSRLRSFHVGLQFSATFN